MAHTLLQQMIIATAIFLAFSILRKLFTNYFFKTILSMTNKNNLDFVNGVLLSFEKPLHNFFVVLGIYASLVYLPLSEAQNILATKIFRSSIIVFMATGVYNFVGNNNLFNKISNKIEVEIDNILFPFVSKIMKFIVVIMTIAIVANEWEYDVNGFIAGLGLGGLAFALAAKDTLANVFGGIVIIADKPFTIGDWILTDGVEGTVEDINFRSTKIRTFAQALVTVPNASLASQSVTNWTRMGKRRITFKLSLTYSTPRVKMERCVDRIREMLKQHAHIHQETIFVHFDQFNESSLDVFLYFFTKTTNWGEFLRVKEDVNFKIMTILEEEQISIAFPSRSIYIEKELKI